MTFENRFLYRPKRVGHPAGLGNDVQVTTEDGVALHARYAMRAYAYFNVLYLHGSRGNLATRPAALRWLCFANANVLGLDYRGYGKSEGQPSEAGLARDAKAAYDWLIARALPSSIVVVGEGLGAGPACELASTCNVGALVLLSAFTSLPDLAAAHYPYIPTSWLLRSQFDNLSKVATIPAPKLFVHSRADERVPFEMGERLYAAASEPKSALWIDRVTHDELWNDNGETLARALGLFLKTLSIG
jgi:fermentation-respiration switch protein FrsA (DUF1100 family)